MRRLSRGVPRHGGCSSAGRAPALQAGGRRFESDHLHQSGVGLWVFLISDFRFLHSDLCHRISGKLRSLAGLWARAGGGSFPLLGGSGGALAFHKVGWAPVFLESDSVLSGRFVFCLGVLALSGMDGRIKRLKSIWWMPWHREAMKDVARCDKPWGVASAL